jgi:hypothetical protein
MTMKNNIVYIAILLLTLSFYSCQKDDPVEMAFEDIYGRESWEVEDDSNFPEGFFYINKTNEVTVSEEGTPESGLTFNISTGGTTPHITTQRITKGLAASNKVLSFMYKSNKSVEPAVSLDIYKSDGFTKMFPLPATSEWTAYTFDMGNLISDVSWGGIGSYLRLYLGDETGAEINIKELQVRARTPEEEDAANAFYFRINTAGINQLDEMVDLTEMNTYNAQTYKYVATLGSNDPWVQTLPRERAIATDENFLTFEYKCESAGNMNLFFVIRGGASTPGLVFEAASEWTEVTFDISATKTMALGNHADAMDAGQPMRCDINGTGGVPFYFRAMRLHK